MIAGLASRPGGLVSTGAGVGDEVKEAIHLPIPKAVKSRATKALDEVAMASMMF